MRSIDTNKKQTWNKAIYLTIVLFSVTSIIQGQNKEGDVYNEKVIVVSGYEPILQESEKMNTPPVIIDTINLNTEFRYDINPMRIYSLFAPEAIRAARLVGEPSMKLYKTYLRLGIGNYMTPLVDAYYNSTSSKTWNYGAHIYHKSSWWSLKDYGSNWFSNTEIDIFGKRIWKDKVLSGDIFYKNDYLLYYGFTDSTWNKQFPLVDRNDLKKKNFSQMYNYVGAKVDFKNTEIDFEKLVYKTSLQIDNLSDRYGSNEFHTHFDGDLHYGFAWFGNEKEILGVKMDWDLYSNKEDYGKFPITDSLMTSRMIADSNNAFTENLFKIQPYFIFKLYGFSLDAGVRFVYSNSSKFALFPNITLSQSFFNEMLYFKAGFVGDMYRNSWQSLRTENPYMAPRTPIENTRYYKVFVDAAFKMANSLDLNVNASYTFYKDLAYFTLDTLYSLHNVFTSVYENTNVLKIGCDVHYQYNENIKGGISANYYYYSLPDSGAVAVPWYKPNFDVTLHLRYRYNNRLSIGLNAVLLGKMKGLNYENEISYEESLPMKYGINLYAEYRYNRALSFFIDFDNVAYQRYFYWANYPSQRFTCMLGVTYTIPTL